MICKDKYQLERGYGPSFLCSDDFYPLPVLKMESQKT